jgi:hypothetical protein
MFMEAALAGDKETTSTSKSGNSVSPWLVFVVGVLLVAVVALLVVNVHGTISGPPGNIDFNVKSPASDAAK